MTNKYDIHIVIGSAFGDEGKGRHTDYLTSKLIDNNPIVIRFNGGAQAGHTVHTVQPLIRHIFGHFGSGTLLDIPTYLSKDFICNPILFRKEYDELIKIGIVPVVYIDKDAMLTIPQDMLINQAIEIARGDDRHGSCGVGINETVVRYREGYGVPIGEIENSEKLEFNILWNRYHYMTDRLESLSPSSLNMLDEYSKYLYDDNIVANYINDYNFMIEHCKLVDFEYIKNNYSTMIFEGAQGLMLSEHNYEYAPNLTTSDTGTGNAIDLINRLEGNVSINVYYLMRCYMTRHGNGRFDTEITDIHKYPRNIVYDNTNEDNEWQGSLRYGYLDIDQIMKYILMDINYVKYMAKYKDAKFSVVVGHLDQLKDGIILGDISGNTKISNIFDLRDIIMECNDIECVYVSNGNTRESTNILCKRNSSYM